MAVCKEAGCDREPVSRGLCRRHYMAWYRERDHARRERLRPSDTLLRLLAELTREQRGALGRALVEDTWRQPDSVTATKGPR